MNESRSAVVRRQEGVWESISLKVEPESFRRMRARGCAEALKILSRPDPPQLIFTDLTAADGNRADVLKLTATSPAPINMIIVSRQVDIRRYLEGGAFDFIVPPLADADLRLLISNAVGGAVERRRRLARSV